MSSRSPALVVLPVAVLCLLVGLLAGPALPWADGRPAEGSAEVGFARDMQVHHAQAVAMSLVALEHSTDRHLRSVALDVTTSQQAQIGTMAGWLDEWGVPQRGPGRPMEWMAHAGDHALEADGRMPGMATESELTELRSLRGRELDVRYAQLLLVHHLGGLPMAEAVLSLTERPSVDALARSILTSQSAEASVLRQIITERGGEVPHVHGGEAQDAHPGAVDDVHGEPGSDVHGEPGSDAHGEPSGAAHG